ncbi:hypothetical protein LCGC14_1737140, partial [marine sediment metagenome]
RNAKIPPLTKGGFAKIQYIHLKTGHKAFYLEVSICFNGVKYNGNRQYCYYQRNSYYAAGNDGERLTETRAVDLPQVDVEIELANYNDAYSLREASNEKASTLLVGHRIS